MGLPVLLKGGYLFVHFWLSFVVVCPLCSRVFRSLFFRIWSQGEAVRMSFVWFWNDYFGAHSNFLFSMLPNCLGQSGPHPGHVSVQQTSVSSAAVAWTDSFAMGPMIWLFQDS